MHLINRPDPDVRINLRRAKRIETAIVSTVLALSTAGLTYAMWIGVNI